MSIDITEEFVYIYYQNHKTLRCFCKGGVATPLYFFGIFEYKE